MGKFESSLNRIQKEHIGYIYQCGVNCALYLDALTSVV